ncbi:MAG: HAD family phosphatase [Candidatus Limnocylindrales bacterium]
MSAPKARATPTAVVFDLGGVLIDWDPRHLYRQLFADEAEMEWFLREVVSPAWNLEHDRGRSFADGVARLTREHPDRADLIAAFHERWPEMLGGPIQPTVDLLAELRDTGIRLLALTNWSAETWPIGRERFGFLGWFEAIVVSGVERLVKPDPAIFRILVDRHGVDPALTVFIDDLVTNVDAATDLGFRAIHFSDAASLRDALSAAGVELDTGRPGR